MCNVCMYVYIDRTSKWARVEEACIEEDIPFGHDDSQVPASLFGGVRINNSGRIVIPQSLPSLNLT